MECENRRDHEIPGGLGTESGGDIDLLAILVCMSALKRETDIIFVYDPAYCPAY